MSHPEYLYYLALIVTALCWRFNPLALLLVSVGAASCLAWRFGILVPASYIAIYTAGLIWSIVETVRRSSTASILTTVLFLPLVVLSGYEWAGLVSGHDAWAGRLWIVLAQLAFVHLDTDWEAIRLTMHRSVPTSSEPDLKRAYA